MPPVHVRPDVQLSLEKCVQISTILATAVIQEVGTTLPAKKWDEIKLNIESLLQV